MNTIIDEIYTYILAAIWAVVILCNVVGLLFVVKVVLQAVLHLW